MIVGEERDRARARSSRTASVSRRAERSRDDRVRMAVVVGRDVGDAVRREDDHPVVDRAEDDAAREAEPVDEPVEDERRLADRDR